jgi:uncharacterized repeat protein (TIGR01451 family)
MVVLILSAPLVVGLAGCGSGTGQLTVTISSKARQYDATKHDTWATYKPGDVAEFTVKVVNVGPGEVSGVTAHVVLPPSLHYRATTSIASDGATRTQPIEAAVNSTSPIWGLWTLAQPGAAGAGKATFLSVTFEADVSGQPGDLALHAFVAGDAAAGQTDAQPYMVAVKGAPKLGALVTVRPPSALRGGDVTYEVRLSNTGTDQASNVGVLVTLPAGLSFTSSVTPFAGNGSRNKGTDPFKGTVVVFYDGFVLPASSNAGPGFVVIVFKATVVKEAQPGSYTVDVHVTDDLGDNFTIHAIAPLTIR